MCTHWNKSSIKACFTWGLDNTITIRLKSNDIAWQSKDKLTKKDICRNLNTPGKRKRRDMWTYVLIWFVKDRNITQKHTSTLTDSTWHVNMIWISSISPITHDNSHMMPLLLCWSCDLGTFYLCWPCTSLGANLHVPLLVLHTCIFHYIDNIVMSCHINHICIFAEGYLV